MKKKIFIVLAVQLFIIIAAGASFFQFSQKQVEPVNVYVFKKDMKVNTPITENDLTQVAIPKKAASKDFLFEFKVDPENPQYASRDVKTGEYVYQTDLLGEGEKDPFKDMDVSKLRKFSMPVNYSTAFGGNVKRGDKVDLVFTGDGSAQTEGMSDSGFQYSRVFMQDVLVYNVTTGDGYPFKDHSDYVFAERTPEENEMASNANTASVAVITLAVTLDQAEELTARMRAGHVRLLGGIGDEEQYETLGYVIGDYDKIFTGTVNAETGRSSVE